MQGVEARDALWHLQTKVLCSNVVLLDTRYHAVGVPPKTMAETTNEAVVQKKTTHFGEETSKEDDGYSWLKKSNKNLHSSLVNLDSSLECPICYDIFCIPISLSGCQHSFLQ